MGAALIALGALAGAVGAVVGSVVGGMLCGQKMASKRVWIPVPKKHKTLFQGQLQVTGDWTMTCPIGGQITYAPNIKSWGQAIALASAGYITDVLEGMTKGALVGLGGAAIAGVGSLGAMFSGSGSAIAGNIGRATLQGLGRIGTNLAEGFFLDVGSKSVEASANVLQNYGESGEWNVVNDFTSGYKESTLEDLNALNNIRQSGGNSGDWEAAIMLLAPGGGGKKDASNHADGNHNNGGDGTSHENRNSESNTNDSNTESETNTENESSVKSNIPTENSTKPTTKKAEAIEDSTTKSQTWQEHENSVTNDLKANNSNVGEQITLDVKGIDANGNPFTKRIRIDNLHKTENGTYQITDAKYSGVKDLTNSTNAELRNTFTKNQKPVYDAIGGKDGASIISVTPAGQRAIDMGLKPGTPINIEPNVQVGVNNPNGGIVYRGYP